MQRSEQRQLPPDRLLHPLPGTVDELALERRPAAQGLGRLDPPVELPTLLITLRIVRDSPDLADQAGQLSPLGRTAARRSGSVD
jgi:hypothetical protein